MKELRGHPASPALTDADRGALLLEVVLSLGIFVGAAAVCMGGLAASRSTVDRLRDEAVAADLAVTILSLVEMETIPAGPTGPEPFEAPFEEWTWELDSVVHGAREVVVRHENSKTVYRLAQLMRVDERRKDGEPRELSPERVKRVRRIFHEERERQKRASEKDRLSLDRSQETRD